MMFLVCLYETEIFFDVTWLLDTEEQILAEYEAQKLFDDEVLCASISGLTTDELICPVCTKWVQNLLMCQLLQCTSLFTGNVVRWHYSCLKKVPTYFLHFVFSHNSPATWNSIPTSIKNRSSLYTVWVKKNYPPLRLWSIFAKRLRIFNWHFAHLLCVQIYDGLPNFI